jgi:hypothetical protein
MAEMNDLLERAVERTRALAAASGQARETVAALNEQARHLVEQTQSADAETRAVCDQAVARLAALSRGLASRAETATSNLTGLIARAAALGENAAEALGHTQERLAEGAVAEQSVLADVARQADERREELAGVESKAGALEKALGRLVPELRAGMDQLRGRLDEARHEFSSSKDDLIDRMSEIEGTARVRLSTIMDESHALGQAAQDRLERLSDDIDRRAQETATRIANRFAQDAVQKTRAAMSAISEALDALRSACRGHASDADRQALEIAQRARRITELFEKHRSVFVSAQRVSY